MSQQAQSFRTIGNVSTTSDGGLNLGSGLLNAIVGSGAATRNTTGVENTVVGTNALFDSTGGSGLVAIGCYAAQAITGASGAVLLGDRVAPVLLAGFDSVLAGYMAGANVFSAQGCVLVGPNTGGGATLVDDVGIGSRARVAGRGATCVGARSAASGDGCVCIGYSNVHAASGGVTIGSGCCNAFASSILIGEGLVCPEADSLVIVSGTGLGTLNVQNVLVGAKDASGRYGVTLSNPAGPLGLSGATGTVVTGGVTTDALTTPKIKVGVASSSWTIALSLGTDAWADLSMTSSRGTQVTFCDDFVPGVLNFTAQHRCVHTDGDDTGDGDGDGTGRLRPGSVLIATGAYAALDGSGLPTIDEAIPIVQVSTVARDSRVFGVVSCAETIGLSDSRRFRVGSMGFEVPRRCTRARVVVNSGGEGGILVCSENGRVCNGDLLVSSTRPGLAMRQGDDVVRSSTIAKATCSVGGGDAADVLTIVLVGCVYLC